MARPAAAHRMDVSCQLIGPKEVQIEALYGKDDPVVGAVVRMLGADGARLSEGETDAAGTCQFLLEDIGEFTFEVVHSGHRGTCTLTQVQQPDAEKGEPANDHEHEEHHHVAESGSGITGIVAGLGFILGLFAFVLALSQRKEIQQLRAELDKERSPRS